LPPTSSQKEKYVVPPHLPETQCGLVISEISQFRERVTKWEQEKMRKL
jgi:hypothetical protein